MIESKTIRDWIEKHIVCDWRLVWRTWSVRLNAIGLALLGWFYIDPVSTLYVWAMLPQDVRDMLPPDIVKYLGMALFAMAILSKFVRQPKLEEKRHELL